MSACTCHVDLKEVVHTGSYIGDDWRYANTIDGTERSIDDQGAGETRDRTTFDDPLRWTTNGNRCGDSMEIEIEVTATEKDVVFDDQGSSKRSILVSCPGPDEGSRTYAGEQLVVRVEERPLRNAMVHWVTFIFDLETVCEGG